MRTILFRLAVFSLLLIGALIFLMVSAIPVSLAASPTPIPVHPVVLSRAFLPIMAKSQPPVGDLILDQLESTQAIQNPLNGVPMVAAKATVLRIYTHNNTTTAIPGAYVAVTATRLGIPLADSPLIAGPFSIPPSWSRGVLNSSINLSLPASWLSGEVVLQITVDPINAFNETNESNNTATLPLIFNDIPPLDIKVVPIQYTDPYNGVTFPEPASDFLESKILRMYPVSSVIVSRRLGIGWRTSLRNQDGWEGLLDKITEIKRSDAAPYWQVYYGLVPVEDDHDNFWFLSGIAGISWLGSRVGLGLTDSDDWDIDGGLIAAHEIGHTLGRDHAPCNVDDVDKDYPYRDGSIGQWGLFPLRMLLYSPEVYSDIMGYCKQQWVSDYTYTALLLDQLQFGGSESRQAGLQPGVLVRAKIGENGAVTLQSTYRFNGRLDPPAADDEWQVQFLDSAGIPVSTYPVAAIRTGEPLVKSQSIIAFIPLPEQSYSSLRVVHWDTPVGEKLMSANRVSSITAPGFHREGDLLNLNWGAPQVPSIVRFSTDEGQTWTTLAFDALEGQITIPLDSLPADIKSTVRFEVILADSLQPAMSVDWIP